MRTQFLNVILNEVISLVLARMNTFENRNIELTNHMIVFLDRENENKNLCKESILHSEIF